MRNVLFGVFCKVGALCLCIPYSVNAQSFEKNYTPLRSTGTLPELFVKSAHVQTEEEIVKLSLDKDKDKETKEKFIRANNYFIKDLLMSGDVLVNDPLTAYVNKVAAEVIEQNPNVGSQPIQIFVTKSPEVNAYAFDKGIIFVNVGLLAQLENEAQLAYILAHEMIHIYKKHSVAEYLQNTQLKNQSSYEKMEGEERQMEKYRFSKEQEFEADIEGLALIKKTKYSAKAVMGAFDVLQYSYLPFELVDFKKSFFEDEYLKIPDTLNLKKVSAIKTNDDYDDSKSSHPNIRKRRLSIEKDVKEMNEAGRKKYLVSEGAFKSMREMARFELCRIYLLKRDYVNAIYGAYILSQKYPDNLYLKKIVARGLYNIVVSKTNKEFSTSIKLGQSSNFFIDDYQRVEGAPQRLYYLLDNLSAAETNVVALSFVYKAAKQYPKDNTLSVLTDSLFSCLANSNKLLLDNFSKQASSELKDTIKQVAIVEEPVEESKYAIIKKQQITADMEETGFIKFAFVGLMKDDEFVERYKKMAGRSEFDKEEYLSRKISSSKKTKEDEFLGINKVIFMDPYYRKVKISNDEVLIKYEESDERQAKLTEIQKKCADLLKIDYVEISTKNISASDIELYNETSLINEWLAERFKHGNNAEIMECSEGIKELIKKRGTKYIALTGVYNSNKKNNSYFFMLLDLESGKVMRSENKQNREKDRMDLLHAYVYNSLMHVSKKAKK